MLFIVQLIDSRFDLLFCFFFFQAEDGIRDLVRSRGLGDVYKRQLLLGEQPGDVIDLVDQHGGGALQIGGAVGEAELCLSLIHI